VTEIARSLFAVAAVVIGAWNLWGWAGALLAFGVVSVAAELVDRAIEMRHNVEKMQAHLKRLEEPQQ
jgi:hypothetical protein